MDELEILEVLGEMEIGQMREHRFSAGILNSSREYFKNAEDVFEVNRINGAWDVAYLNTEQMAKYLLGELSEQEMKWE